MAKYQALGVLAASCLLSFTQSACVQHHAPNESTDSSASATRAPTPPPPDYASRLPSHINTAEKTILIDPKVHAWGAYADGKLIRAGLATAGSNWCPDIHRACRTRAGTFHVQSLGSPNCKSTIYPLPKGGAPMPYCMFFNGNQGLHGSYQVVEGNVSHGCVRLKVPDAEWLRYNFINIGTKVVVETY
jgi:lipoprotein-anchoring transpeptidase ErfK/SrfK